MTNLLAQETCRNATANYIMGESDVYETFTDDRGELFRALRRHYGGCTGKVYVETAEGERAVGWVFQKTDRYEDTDEPFLREVWVTLHTAPPTRTVQFHYAEESARQVAG